ncbi:MAG: hypothetical protein FWH54_04750 [Methanobrevibacter sp.]|nr:hypothetical protein [Methanobrevibacter sp.]
MYHVFIKKFKFLPLLGSISIVEHPIFNIEIIGLFIDKQKRLCQKFGATL